MKHSRFDTIETWVLLVVDGLAILAAYLAAYRLRFQTDIIPFIRMPSRFVLYSSGLVFVCCFLAALWMNNLYGRRRSLSPVEEVARVLAAVSVGMLFSVAVIFFAFNGVLELSRLMVAYDWVLSVVLVSAGRAVLSMIESSLRRRGIGNKRLLIVGSGAAAQVVLDKIGRSPQLGYEVVGLLSEDGRPANNGVRVLGGLLDAGVIVRDKAVDEVIIALNRPNAEAILEVIDLLDGADVPIKVLPDVVQMITVDAGIDDLNGLPLVAVRPVALRGANVVIKRLLDIVVSAFVLVFLSWLFIPIALLVKLESSGPVFYIQERVGKDGKVFPCIKFRSMVADAEAETGPVWSHQHDQRKTRFGGLLRKLSLDELPQFVNVLLGHMSVVGPRPERPVFVEEFSSRIPHYMERHAEKSGITGWAQVNGLRGNTSIEERTKYDLWYVENWSLVLDLKIMLKTLFIMFTDKQAY